MSTREFISAIKAKEILWNFNHKDHNNIQEKQELWKEIGNQFNLEIIECKRKWKRLQMILSRQNLIALEKELPPDRVGVRWKYAKDMKFLIPLVEKKSFLFDNKESDNSSVYSVETDMEATPLDSIVAKPKNQRKSTTKGNSIQEIIEAVKQRQILWNYNDPNFECEELKDVAWNEIESELGIPAENCKKKWQCLKVYLARECAKHLDNRSTWTYFKQLDFLRPFIELDNSQFFEEQDDSYKAPSSVTSETKNDFPDQVIREVQKYPLLWNLYNKNYKSVYKKLKAWKKVARSLESSVDEVKKKWKALRDIFARSYGKNPDERSNTWPHFHQMLFLAPHLKIRKLSAAQSIDHTKVSDNADMFSSAEEDSDKNENKVKKRKRRYNNFTNEEFIDAIQKQHVLWDSSFNNYRNKKLRWVVWQEVSDYFGLSVEDCKKKWKGLRDFFVRNYIKPIREEDIHWKHYNQMKFLEPHLKERRDDPLGSLGGLAAGDLKSEEKENSLSSFEETQCYEKKNSRLLSELNMEEFINVVKRHELLWNMKNKNYRSKHLRSRAWEKIANHFNLSRSDECRKRWKSLRDAFCRNYYKPIREEKKSWKYYNEMKFLVPNLRYRYKKGLNMLNDSSEEADFKHKGEEEQLTEDDFSSEFEEIGIHDIESKTSEQFCVEEFIDEVQKHSMLWNSNDENYRNNDLRTKEWEKIALHFDTSVEECKKKWKALRDSFVRNYFKPIKEKYKGWNYYEKMKFLGPHVKYKKGKSLVGDSDFKRRNDDSFSSSLEDKTKLFTVKEFVNEIKKHTILWDLSDERCKMKEYRLEAWKEISAYFCISPLECKRKWSTLRSAFIREFAKYPDNDMWENFKELDFLLPYLKANVSTNHDLGASETAFPLNEVTSVQKDDLISFESNEINSESQNIFAYPDESWIEDFIQIVKQQPILWDTTESNYKNALKRQQAWNKIAKAFDLSIDDSKQKWKTLSDTFVVCLNNYKGPKEFSQWKYFNAMTFMRPHLELKKFGESLFEANNDSDSCSTKSLKLQANTPVAIDKPTIEFIQNVKEKPLVWNSNCSEKAPNLQKHEALIDEKSTIELIEAVEEKELLWNWTEDDHNDKDKREEAWGQIAKKFSSSITRCKERWQTLQNIYTRIILSHSIDRKHSWKYMEKMDFLRPFINTHIDTPNFVEVSGCLGFDDIIEECNSIPEQSMVSKADDQDDALYEELFECSPSECSENIEKNEVQKHSTRERAAAKRRKCSETSSDDEDKDFFRGLKDTMKKLPRDCKSEAKSHIQAYLKVVSSNHS